jgi:hypothetical protein
MSEKITANNYGDFTCLCGNVASSDGFIASDIKGNELEPIIGGKWKNLYTCNRCGRVINQDTLEVVNKVKEVKWAES